MEAGTRRGEYKSMGTRTAILIVKVLWGRKPVSCFTENGRRGRYELKPFQDVRRRKTREWRKQNHKITGGPYIGIENASTRTFLIKIPSKRVRLSYHARILIKGSLFLLKKQ